MPISTHLPQLRSLGVAWGKLMAERTFDSSRALCYTCLSIRLALTLRAGIPVWHPFALRGGCALKPTNNSPLSLVDLSVGQQGRVEALSGGRSLVSRLAVLGFIPGQEVTMIHNFGHGPIIVTVCGTRVALGRHEAHSITVRGSAEIGSKACKAWPKVPSVA
jgi:Fe2+ transport system protein FeoA